MSYKIVYVGLPFVEVLYVPHKASIFVRSRIGVKYKEWDLVREIDDEVEFSSLKRLISTEEKSEREVNTNLLNGIINDINGFMDYRKETETKNRINKLSLDNINGNNAKKSLLEKAINDNNNEIKLMDERITNKIYSLFQ